ncbi:MAG: GNAT family N-acetyltransferase [Pseudomonadota bacterium]
MTPAKDLVVPPVIETARLRLAALSPADAPALQRLTDDPAITAMIHFLHSPFTLADAQALIADNSTARDRFMGVFGRGPDTADGLIGTVGVHLRGDAEIEIGYWIASALHGRGIAAEAARGVLDWLVADWPERRIVAECRRENVASWRLLETLGFRPTGAAGSRPGRQLLVRAS